MTKDDAESKKRYSEESQALLSLQSTVLKAFSEVETALATDHFLAEREHSLSEAVELAGEASEEALSDYRGGVGDLLTVLTTQNRHLQVQSRFLTARRERLDNRVDLHLALGGDYQASN